MNNITFYTDGSCIDKSGPGRGGYGVVAIINKDIIEISKGYNRTTNNRMELMAGIVAISLVDHPSHIHIYTDSQYFIDGTSNWIYGWKKNGWTTRDGRAVKNKDLWLYINDLIKPHQITFHKVKAHSGNLYNEKADVLAKYGANNPTEIDHGFIE